MKLLNLDPVTMGATAEELEYMGKYLGPDTELVSWQIAEGPVSIECEYDEAMAAPAILELCQRAEREGFDGIFIDCFGDPAVRAARELVNIPVFGGFEPVMHLALGLADKVAIVTVLPNVVPAIRGNIAKAHLDDRVVCVRNVDMPVLDLGNHEKLCNELVNESVKAILTDGAEAIVLGCTAMIDVAETVKARLKDAGYDVPVLEGAQSSLMLLELCAKMRLEHSRLTYLPIPKK